MCISLKANDVEQLFMGLSATCVFSGVKSLFESSPICYLDYFTH